MIDTVDRPPCPICGAPRCVLVRSGAFGETCGNVRCAAKFRAQQLGPAHYQKLQAAAWAHRKPKLRSAEYEKGYTAGLATGRRTGFKAGYAAAKGEAQP